LQPFGCVWCGSYTVFARIDFFWDTNLHWCSPFDLAVFPR
jgi:hypothetical protein